MEVISRRDLLRVGAVAAGLPLCSLAAEVPRRAKSCIVLLLAGGPGQLETWDPKPDAPAEVRGPFGSIATNVAGVRISEHLPRLANMAHRFAILRTIHHRAAPMHEAGMQLLQTGRLHPIGAEFPHFGSVLARNLGSHRAGAVPFVVLPFRIANTGVAVGQGQGPGFLGNRYEPVIESNFALLLPSQARDRYGKTAFGDGCARAVNLVENGTRCVVVNMFDSVYDRITWDCHAQPHVLRSTLDDYRRTLCPTLDRALSSMLDDLHQRGLLDETLVIAMGEMGRSPRVNSHGGRDHWTGCWSIVMAGGGVRGGQIVGISDRNAAEPARRPIACAEVVATVYDKFGISPSTQLVGADRVARPLVDAAPIRELR